MTARIREFLKHRNDEGPCLVVDLDVVRENYLAFAKALPDTQGLLCREGQSGAGNPQAPGRARLLLRRRLGRARPKRCSRPAPRRTASPTATRSRRRARSPPPSALGVTLFAVDCEAEVEKVARAAPGSRVICRIHCDGTGAGMAAVAQVRLRAGLTPPTFWSSRTGAGSSPHGISFHVGSQQHNVEAWDRALASDGGDLPRLRRARHHPRDGQSRRRLPGQVPAQDAEARNPTARRSSARCAGISATPSRKPSSSRAAAWSAMPA